jgi:hypothetical protein
VTKAAVHDTQQLASHKRGEFVERSFAHVLERGGMRRTLAFPLKSDPP